MKKISLIIIALAFMGCARGKMGAVTKPLDRSKVSQETTLYVFPVATDDIRFEGDKAEDTARLKEEKAEIAERYHSMLISKLIEFGYKAEMAPKNASEGIAIKGKVTRFDHGSGAARALVGMGAGASNLYTDFVVMDMTNKEVIGKFEVIATSGGRGGLSAMSSFIDAHLTDGSEKAAEYLTGKTE